MNMCELIEKKKNGKELEKSEIYFIIDGYTNGSIPDYQMSAFLMAVCFKGMTNEEVFNLTAAMKESGDEIDMSGINGVVVDKHSTGGVGDKVSLVLGPMVAACGVPVAKMSGRGLGHTGGTIDKLECFTGFNISPSEEEFIRNVNDIGISWAGQTANLAPADKKIYALRDVTATVDSIPLIASSIMSKKLASGAAGIVLDVTFGLGAFMKNTKEAEKLAELMIDIGVKNGRKMSAVITNMDEPLGYAAGNVLEVIEAIDCLCGRGPEDVMEAVYALGSHMLYLNGKCSDMNTARELLEKTITEKTALNKMAQWVEHQGGNKDMVYNTELFEKAKIIKPLYYDGEDTEGQSHYVCEVNGKNIGMAVLQLGGGRTFKDEKIDLSVGVKVLKKVRDIVKNKEPFAIIYANDKAKMKMAEDTVRRAFKFSEKKSEKTKVVYREIY